ncbi:MAG TPA: GGDEF domain-containing protein [Bryobacteraceae bacterium]|nr:GGDEF domain-containing protein [Bryobacteraceae bacterium]
MSTGLIPIVVEVLTTLAFCGVLIYLRKKMTRRTVALWVALWVARGAISLAALRFLAGPDRLVFLMYAPLQVAIAMALVIIAVRLESQKQQLRSLNDELARLRKDAEGQMDLDPLTGLKNRSALARWMDEQSVFDGLVVVSDMDDFKSINDKYGHLVGDEILHGVGKLIRSSIRETDLAFRWGGDEFVIFFHTRETKLVDSRMCKIEEHLANFRIREHGALPVHFSWGVTSTAGRPLRECVEEADRLMYESKRTHRGSPAG